MPWHRGRSFRQPHVVLHLVLGFQVKWSWLRHVFDEGLTTSSYCRNFGFIFWLRQSTLLLCTQYGPHQTSTRNSAPPFLGLFLSPTHHYPLFGIIIIITLDRHARRYRFLLLLGFRQAPYPD